MAVSRWSGTTIIVSGPDPLHSESIWEKLAVPISPVNSMLKCPLFGKGLGTCLFVGVFEGYRGRGPLSLVSTHTLEYTVLARRAYTLEYTVLARR